MGLAEVQVFLARLYTDPELRARFLADPTAAAVAAGLDADDVAGAAHVPPTQVRLFARSLLRKRLGEVAKLLPATRAAVGDRFARWFFGYAETTAPDGIDKHWRDAQAFAAYLLRMPELDELPMNARETLRYEAAWLRALDPGRRFQVRGFRYATRDLLRPDRLAGPRMEPPACPTVVTWWRFSATGCLHQREWQLPFGASTAPARAVPDSAAPWEFLRTR
jgi:hypothetical protein